MRKVRECRKLKEEGKMTDVEMGAVTERAERVVCCMRGEMSHFHSERIRDFALMSRDYLRKQAEFYEKIASELRKSLDAFDNIGVDPWPANGWSFRGFQKLFSDWTLWMPPKGVLRIAARRSVVWGNWFVVYR